MKIIIAFLSETSPRLHEIGFELLKKDSRSLNIEISKK